MNNNSIKVNKDNRCHYKQVVGGWEAKKVYNSFHEARVLCTKQNIFCVTEFKLIPYKCKICNEIHIGKDKTVLNDLNSIILNKVKIFSLSII